MWLLIPIGHDQGIRHFPWVTGAIAAVCLVVQTHRSFSGPSDQELGAVMQEIADLESELLAPHMTRKLKKLQAAARTSDSEMLDVGQSLADEQAALRAALVAGTLVDASDERYRAWQAARAREQQLLRRDLGYRLAYRPSEGLSIGLLLSAFAHGSWTHLLGNLLFLYLVGCNLEDRWGRAAFSALYAGGAVVSAGAFYLWHPGSETMLMGASGAVAAVMGAFLVCFHRARIRLLYWSLFRTAHVSEVYAFWVFPFWFGQQLLYSWLEAYLNVGVAYSAHVGGFVFGLALAGLLRWSGIERRHLLPRTAAGTEWKEDPDYLQALELIAAQDLAGAVAPLQAVLARNPRHQNALEQLARTAMRLGDSELAGQALSAYIDELSRSRMQEVLPLVQELRVLDQPVVLSDRAGGVVVRAAAAAEQPELTVKAAIQLIKQHPSSPLAASVMWEVARLQERLNRQDLARATLQQLVSRYPDDPFAEQARRKLEA